MKIWIISLILVSLSIALMAVGVILGGQKKQLAGSCGGLNKVLGQPGKECDYCGRKDLCENEKEFSQRKRIKYLDPLI